MNIPEGWKLVPIEPTEGMRIASLNAPLGAEWEASLAAAPTPPAQESEPVAYTSVLGLIGAKPNDNFFNLPPRTPLYTRPATYKLRKAAEEAEAVLEELMDPEASGPTLAEIVSAHENLRRALDDKE